MNPRVRRLQELVTHIGRCPLRQLIPRDTMLQRLRQMVPDADLMLCSEAISRAEDLHIVGRAGGYYLVRRPTTQQDLEAIARATGFPDVPPEPIDPDTVELARLVVALPAMEERLQALQARVEGMSETHPGHHHWLELHTSHMPRSVRDGLRADVLLDMADIEHPEEADIHRRMVSLAAHILQNAYRKK